MKPLITAIEDKISGNTMFSLAKEQKMQQLKAESGQIQSRNKVLIE